MVGSIDGSPRGSDGVLGPQGTGGVNETTQSSSQSSYTGGVPDASSKDDLNTLLSGPTLEAPDSQFSQMSFPELSALCTEAIKSAKVPSTVVLMRLKLIANSALRSIKSALRICKSKLKRPRIIAFYQK